MGVLVRLLLLGIVKPGLVLAFLGAYRKRFAF